VEKRVSRSLKLLPRIDRELVAQASNEHRAPANLAEMLIDWSLKQLAIAGNSINLVEWKAVPPSDIPEGQELDTYLRWLKDHLQMASKRIAELEKAGHGPKIQRNKRAGNA
jgi:hypothetical protein